MALALKPRVLLLDEPTAGMGEQETFQVASLIRRLHRNSAYTIVLIEHDMRVVFNLADRITVLAEGAMLADGTPQRDRRQPGGAGRLSGSRRMNALEAEGLSANLRQEPHSARCRAVRARRPHHGPAGPQRRRQDHDAEKH